MGDYCWVDMNVYIRIRKAQGKCDFKEFELVEAIAKIAIEIGKNID
jgi:hypothetical protein